MYYIYQLCANNKYPNLQTWRQIKVLEKLPEQLNVGIYDLWKIYEELEVQHCEAWCLHRFKIVSGSLDRIVFHSDWI